MVAISVVLPTYNSSETVARAIQSVFAQTFTDWELVIIDDASTDKTVQLLREHCASDPRVIILTKETNGGPAESRNTAIGHATGNWITLLDSDDAWRNDRLSSLYSAREGFDFIADNIMTYDSFAQVETGPLFDEFDLPNMTLHDLLRGWVGTKRLDGGYLKPLMRSQFLRDSKLTYNRNLRQGEDFVFYCEALCCNARFRLLNNHSYVYTTSIGRRSRRSSPHSRTTADPVAMAEALREVSHKYSRCLGSSERSALDRFVTGLSKSKWTWRFEAARRKRNYLLCLSLIVRHSSVSRHILRAFVSQIMPGRSYPRPE